MKISVVVCTHNRADLLDRLMKSLAAADRPDKTETEIEVLVIANACSDHTEDLLDRWEREGRDSSNLAVRWAAEPRQGKSNALNKALGLLDSNAAVFIDDDQRIAKDFLVAVVRVLEANTSINIFCGRLIPDWDGQEPDWVHDTGPYRIYPPPITTFDAGESHTLIDAESLKPPGGNLIYRTSLLKSVGQFSTQLGPQGHDFAGGEDNEYLQRALAQGELILYAPDIVQYHYVDLDRLRLSQLLRMSYQRSRASARVHRVGAGVPLYLWRRLVEYLLSATFSLSSRRTRFYLVRSAAVLGEIRGLGEVVGDSPIGQ